MNARRKTRKRTASRRDRVPTCPGCGKRDQVVPILRGFPSEEAIHAVERGEISLGGCMPGQPGDPEFHCKRDDLDF